MATWRRTLLENSNQFLAWLDSKNRAEAALEKLASDLFNFICSQVQTADDARALWNVIPDVRAACNFETTYEKDFAAEAYAYVHLLDRYWRTFDVLREITSRGALPIASNGVQALDVGTGPGPTPYAIQDFYELLRQYGHEHGLTLFQKQTLKVSIVEKSTSMQRFLHHFSERSLRAGPFGADSEDLSMLDFAQEREKVRQKLLREDWYEAETGDYYPTYSPCEANNLSQAHHRYRLAIFSNFFTLNETVEFFAPRVSNIYSDLRHGGTVIILSAKSGHYGPIHKRLEELAIASGLKPLPEVPTVLGGDTYDRVAASIKLTQNRIFNYLENTAGTPLVKDKQWPDYWNPNPHPGRRTEFALRVYRKGKWPTIAASDA